MGLPLLSAFLSYQILARLDSSLPTKKRHLPVSFAKGNTRIIADFLVSFKSEKIALFLLKPSDYHSGDKKIFSNCPATDTRLCFGIFGRHHEMSTDDPSLKNGTFVRRSLRHCPTDPLQPLRYCRIPNTTNDDGNVWRLLYVGHNERHRH